MWIWDNKKFLLLSISHFHENSWAVKPRFSYESKVQDAGPSMPFSNKAPKTGQLDISCQIHLLNAKVFCQLCAPWRAWKLGCTICVLDQRRMPFSSPLTSRGYCSRTGKPWTKLPTRSRSRQKQCWCVHCRTEKAASCAAAETDCVHVLPPFLSPVVVFTCRRWSFLSVMNLVCFWFCHLCISFGLI